MKAMQETQDTVLLRLGRNFSWFDSGYTYLGAGVVGMVGGKSLIGMLLSFKSGYTNCWIEWIGPNAVYYLLNKKAIADKPARLRKHAKIVPIRRAYNVVADNTGLSSFV